MNQLTRITPAVSQGWTDPRLREAHALIEAVLHRFPPNSESDAANMIRQILDDVEAVDCKMERG